MGTASKYWRQIKINSSGSQQIWEIAEAKHFFTSNFPEYFQASELPDIKIQRQLLEWVRNNSIDSNRELNSLLAERCLLCFISWQIAQVCQYLSANFGKNYGFSSRDLYPYVLTDDGRISSQEKTTSTPSFAQEILQSFDPNQGSLATWTARKVKQNSELNRFLLECGVYLISDWALLNDISPKQMEKIFSSFYNFSSFEIRESFNLLSSYHAIYRAQRRQQRLAGVGKKCLPPTAEQLQEIAQLIETQTGQKFSKKLVMTKLKNLASQLRQYRIYVKTGSLPTTSLDISEHEYLANQISSSQATDTIDEQSEFLRHYQQQFILSLDNAIAKVTDIWVQLFKRKKSEKSAQFIQALHLFHCQGKSMGEIAASVGLKAQYQVTRLLQLKSFRADIRQQLLISLRGRILEIAQDYTNPKKLKNLDQQIEKALDEQVTKLIEEAEAEGYISPSRPAESLFAQRVCHYLDLIINSV
ncbi:MAG: hypothetical protein WBA93_27495 [Microcoleaceae cyanobacterium]